MSRKRQLFGLGNNSSANIAGNSLSGNATVGILSN